jgi:hypothetical protein
MALQAPVSFQGPVEEVQSLVRIIWDSGASISVTPDKNDFVGHFSKTTTHDELKGIAQGLKIRGQGHVLWAFPDKNSNLRLLKIPAYYVPETQVRLLSTTSLLQTYQPETIFMEDSQLTLSGTDDPTRPPIVAPVDPTNNLPTTYAHPCPPELRAPYALSALSVVGLSNTNISEPEKELLRWHFRLGHLAFKKIQFLMRTGVLGLSQAACRLHTAASKLVRPPKFAACQYGKQTCLPSPGKVSSTVHD